MAFSAKRGHFLCNRAPYWRFLPGESAKDAKDEEREDRKSEKLGANRRGLRANRGRREGVEGRKAWKVRCKGRESGA